MAARKSAARGDKAKPTTKEQPRSTSAAEPTPSTSAPPADQAAGAAPEAEEAPENYWWYTFRQHIGLVLGTISIALTCLTWEEGNPNSVWRMVGCLSICCVGLIAHEMRPFKRRGYGDVAWERFTANPSYANMRATGAIG